MNRIGLVEVRKDIISRLRSNAELRLAQLVEFDEASEFISLLKDDAEAFDVVMVGQSIPEPILLAQQIQLFDKTTTVLLQSNVNNRKALLEAIRFSPFLSASAGCELADCNADPDQLAHDLVEAAQHTVKRRRHQTLVSASWNRLTDQPPPRTNNTAYLEHFFDNAPIGMVVVNAQGVVQASNNAANSVLHPGSPSSHAASLAGYFSKPSSLDDSIRQAGSEPSATDQSIHSLLHDPERHIQVTVNVFNGQPGEAHDPTEANRIVLLQDITERVRAEREAKQRRKLEEHSRILQESNRELEQFAYVASHDLREPLRTVSSYVQLLARRYSGQLDDEADQFIGFAVDGAKRMETLINDLLLYSQVGTQKKKMESVDLEEVLTVVLRNLEIAISDADARVTHDPLPSVSGDRTQFTQLLQNLIGNAIKFRRSPSPLIRIGAESQAGEWLISVRDEGIGIPLDQLERIFLIFQRLHSSEEYTGTGIGLAVCRRIVERHGGKINVESTEGQGSCFKFTLPISR
tara:strand:+ start:553 stop:2109 length:1557 start_codon:yes stop_codon:yes gene_type:complete